MLRVVRESALSAEERARILRRPSLDLAAILPGVRSILDRVRAGGDRALRELTEQYDGVRLDALAASPDEFARSEKAVAPEVRRALENAAARILDFHRRGIPEPFETSPLPGVTLGRVVVPYAIAGVYIPGGRAVYPSSLLMGCVPAAAAGVKRIIVCTPPRKDGSLAPEVLVAARIAGAERVYKVGGAQAVGALAFGTESVPKADVIVGPGNQWVTAAKKVVRESAAAAIDFLAGPTEILVLSDGTGRPEFLAADLVAQAEHDENAACVLVTTDEPQARAVAAALAAQVPACSRAATIGKALRQNGAAVVCASIDAAVAFTNEYAPEHLLISTRDPKATLGTIRNAGSAFLGEYASVPLGDYGSGPNAILPTLGEARYHPGLSAAHFLRHLAYQAVSAEGLEALAPDTLALAKVEGLDAHAKAVEIRRGQPRAAGSPRADAGDSVEDSIGNWT